MIVGRLRPGSEESVAAAFAESDASDLPALVGVVSRRLYAIEDLYIHIVDTDGDFAEGVARGKDHPLFGQISERLAPFVEPLNPETWKSPRDAFARQFYRWDRPADGPKETPAPAPSGVTGVQVVDLEDIDPMTARGGTIRIAVAPGRSGSRHHIFGQARLEPGEEIHEHVHDYGEESVLVISGRGTMIADGERIALTPDRSVFAPRGTRHAIVNDGDETLVMVFASSPLAPTPASGHRETAR